MKNKKIELIEEIRAEFKNSHSRTKLSLINSIEALATDLYNKDTHFIFELIQNAEDNYYGDIEPSLSFRLSETDPTNTKNSQGALIIENNELGFTTENVDAICAVGKTTKDKKQGYIGEKGIGFKSVFRITSTPYILSNGYSFCLPEKDHETGLGYIVPKWADMLNGDFNLSQTTIILPLDKKNFGYEKIRLMLKDLEPEVILFLSKLKEINISTDSGDSITIIKDDSKLPVVQVLVQGTKSEETYDQVNEFFLYSRTFERPEEIVQEKRDGITKREVSIAIPFDTNYKGNGKIFAYLPVRADTGFPFLMNADFILPSSREDIKDVPWNRWLMQCFANLIGETLYHIKSHGLITCIFLEALAHKLNKLTENEMNLFYPILEGVNETLSKNNLLPANDGDYISAKHAKLARGEKLRELFTHEQLSALFELEVKLKWLNEEITTNLTPELRNYLIKELNVDEVTPRVLASQIEEDFLVDQSDEWMINFYEFVSTRDEILKHSSRHTLGHSASLSNKPIIRLQNNSHVKPFKDDGSPNVFLSKELSLDSIKPLVKDTLSANEDVYRFLSDMGIPEYDLVEQVIDNVLPRYSTDSGITFNQHLEDIQLIQKALRTDSKEKKKRLMEQLRKTPFLLKKYDDENKLSYSLPEKLFVDDDDLVLYFANNSEYGCIDSCYSQSLIPVLLELGLIQTIPVQVTTPQIGKSEVKLSWDGNYRKGLNGYDPDIEVTGLEDALTNPNVERSRVIWNSIVIKYKHCIKGTLIKASTKNFVQRPNSYYEVFQDHVSDFGQMLISNNWLPAPDGNLAKPSEISLDDLPESFYRDETVADLLDMKKDELGKLAEKVGVLTEDIHLMLQNKTEFEEWKNAIISQKMKPEFPDQSSSNPERRSVKSAERYGESPDKKYEERKRNVRTSRNKIDPAVWLRNNYTNNKEEMVCQVCKDEMPFRKLDGQPYFEAVELFSKKFFKKENRVLFAAMCPVCSAKYQEFIKKSEDTLLGLKHLIEVSNEPEIFFQLGEEKASIRFVEKHFIDLKSIISNHFKDEN